MKQRYDKNNLKARAEEAYLAERKKITQLCNAYDKIELRKLTEGVYDPWDASIQSGSTILITEIKVRDYKAETFQDAYLEKKKVDTLLWEVERLQERANKFGFTLVPYYVAFYRDGIARGWVITGEEKDQVKQAPYETKGQTGRTDKLLKEFKLFPLQKGELFII